VPAQQPNVSAPPQDVTGVKQHVIEAPAEPQL
jgi:hypothetical protein